MPLMPPALQRTRLAKLLMLRSIPQWTPQMRLFKPHKLLPMQRLRSLMRAQMQKQTPLTKLPMLPLIKRTKTWKTKDRSSSKATTSFGAIQT
jgi:hypothetical protein